MVAFDPADPSRLYVTRVSAAINAGLGALDRSQFGYGGVDADGNLCFRADSFGSTGPATSLLVGDNYFRVRLAARSTVSKPTDSRPGHDRNVVESLVSRTRRKPATVFSKDNNSFTETYVEEPCGQGRETMKRC